MNRLGGKSNTGEGGEDEERYLDTTKGTILKLSKNCFYTFDFTIFFLIRNESAIRNQTSCIGKVWCYFVLSGAL